MVRLKAKSGVTITDTLKDRYTGKTSVHTAPIATLGQIYRGKRVVIRDPIATLGQLYR